MEVIHTSRDGMPSIKILKWLSTDRRKRTDGHFNVLRILKTSKVSRRAIQSFSETLAERCFITFSRSRPCGNSRNGSSVDLAPDRIHDHERFCSISHLPTLNRSRRMEILLSLCLIR